MKYYRRWDNGGWSSNWAAIGRYDINDIRAQLWPRLLQDLWEGMNSPSISELPLTSLFLHCFYCLSVCRWSSLNRTPAPPSVCTRCSMWTLETRSTPTRTTTTCRSVPALELAVNSLNNARVYMQSRKTSCNILHCFWRCWISTKF